MKSWWIGAALLGLALLGFFLARPPHTTTATAPPAPVTSPAPVVSRTPSPSAAAAIVAPKRPADPHLFVRAGWGAGAGQLGKKIDQESAPEGPMSLVVDGKGNLYVLDEVNHRIQRWSSAGAPLSSIAIGGDTAQDLALGRNGRVAVLDRLAEHNVQMYSADGQPIGEVSIVGKGIPEGGGTTGLFADRDGNLWVEREHQELVRVADANGHSDPDRPTAPGRPTRDGRLYLSGAIADRAAGTALIRGLDRDGKVIWQQLISLGAPILYLSLLDSDASGNVYVAGHVGRESPQPPFHVVDEQLVIVGLSPDGAPRGMITLPASPPVAETFRELSVGDDGTIYRMVLGAAGVVVESYRL